MNKKLAKECLELIFRIEKIAEIYQNSLEDREWTDFYDAWSKVKWDIRITTENLEDELREWD